MPEDVILIVEDDIRQRALLGEFLSANNLKVLTAGNCLEAEHVCRTQRPDAAILDYELPDGNALDLMRRLRTIDASLAVIILTGQGSIERAVEAVKLGADQFLTKPTDLATLLVRRQDSGSSRSRPLCGEEREHTEARRGCSQGPEYK
jgi:DNA-binding response OmpR family regulator